MIRQRQHGFRLGVLEDFSLLCEAEDPVLDDMIHVDTTAEGVILAGSNPGSVLFAMLLQLFAILNRMKG